jgi:hypothetical protein
VGQRESVGTGEKNGADSSAPQSNERERGSERSGWRRQAGPACQAPRACARARLSGLVWTELAFSFPRISNCFSIYFL